MRTVARAANMFIFHMKLKIFENEIFTCFSFIMNNPEFFGFFWKIGCFASRSVWIITHSKCFALVGNCKGKSSKQTGLFSLNKVLLANTENLTIVSPPKLITISWYQYSVLPNLTNRLVNYFLNLRWCCYWRWFCDLFLRKLWVGYRKCFPER